MGLRVRAIVTYEWQCPKCKLWLQEGNPLACPHQEGQGVKYKPQKDGQVINVAMVLRKLGFPDDRAKNPAMVARPPEPVKKPDPKPDMVSGLAPVISSVQDLVDLQCPKGT